MVHNIIVVGAGAAGLACAISAATQGANVTLVEKMANLGGTVAHSLIHTIGGLYDDAGDYINEGLPITLTESLLHANVHTAKRRMGKVWTLSVDPAIYESVIERWVARFANITVLRNAYPTQIQIEGSRVEQISVTNGKETMTFRADALVDATGSAAVVRRVDASKVVEGDALSGLIFQIRGVAPNALKFPKNVGMQRTIKKAINAGNLSTLFTRTWFDRGVYPDEVYAKANILLSAYDEGAVPELRAQLLRVLQRMPDFAQAQIVRVGRLGVRDGGRIKGDYCLTLDDIKAGRQFADSVGRCAWPIEYWDPRKGVTLDHLPPHHTYEIPLPSLKVAGFENLWAVGKCLSAEKLAQASARVAGTCWAMGDALGQVLTH